MSFYNHQDQALLNWLHSCEQKDVGNALMIPNPWSPYSSPDTVTAVSPFQPTVYEDSPVISTPTLFNGPTFTGDPIDLLINKSKGVNSSPTYSSSPSGGIATPLFVPIASALNDDGASNQQYGLQQHEVDAFLQENRPHEVKNELAHWSCFHGDDISLFHELEGMINTDNNESSTFAPNNKTIEWSPFPSPLSSSSAALSASSSSVAAETITTAPVTTQKQKKNKSGRNATAKKITPSKRNGQQDDDDDNKNNKKRQSATKAHKMDQGEKRFACPICRRKFSRRYNLNTHIRTHNVNRIKEFVCDICNYRFDRKHDRDRHLISVHRGERDYACQHCDASFCRRDALARHTLKSHPNGA